MYAVDFSECVKKCVSVVCIYMCVCVCNEMFSGLYRLIKECEVCYNYCLDCGVLFVYAV